MSTDWEDYINRIGTSPSEENPVYSAVTIGTGLTLNGNIRQSRGTIASSNFSSGTTGYSLDAATGNIETNSNLVCGNIHVKAATDDVDLSGATGNAIIGVSTSAQHLAFDANEIMSKSDATTAGTLFLQHNGGTLAVGGGAVGTFRVGSDDGTSHKSVASFSHGGHAAPSITFNSDLDTGFFRESANTIGSTGNFTMSKTGSSATLTVSTFADAPGTESIIVLRSADNTLASPALRDTGDNLGEIHFAGHDGTDYAVGAKISVAASAATGDNDMGATIKLQTTPDGSATPATRLAVDHVGRVFLTAASADSAVDLDGVSGTLLIASDDGGDSHMAFSSSRIQTKTDATTATDLLLNYSGGNVTMGGGNNVTWNATNLNLAITSSTAKTPDSNWSGQFQISAGTGSAYTGGIAIDNTAMWVGHNSGARDLYLATDETARLKIAADGQVTQPNIPAFRVANETGGAGYIYNGSSVGAGVIVFGSDSGTGLYDNGNNYNTTSGTFTAPVTGYYYFSMTIFMYTTYDNDDNRYWGFNSSNGQVISNHGIKGQDGGGTVAGVFYLDAGDTCQGYVFSSLDLYSWRTQNYNSFQGFLVG